MGIPQDALSSGERCIKIPTITPNGKGQVEPWTMVSRALGGADCDYDSGTGAGQRGVKDSSDVNNIGLLVRVTGRVTFVGDAF